MDVAFGTSAAEAQFYNEKMLLLSCGCLRYGDCTGTEPLENVAHSVFMMVLEHFTKHLV